MRLLALLLCVSTLALAASGCGGGGGGETSYSGAKPDAWAATVCGALADWARGLKADSDRLSSELSGATDLNTVKTKFVSFLQNAERSSGIMVTEIRGAGQPAVKDGAAIQRELLKGLEGAEASFTHAITKAKALPTANSAAFGKGVATLGKEVEAELTATSEQFNTLGERYDDEDLNEATSKEPACTSLSTSAS